MADSGCLLLARTLLSFCSLQFLSFSPLILQEPLVESCTKQERELRGGKKRGRTLKAALNLLCPSSSVQFSSGWLASLYFARHRFLCSAFFFKLSSSSSSCCLRKKEPKWESDSTNKWPPVSLSLSVSVSSHWERMQRAVFTITCRFGRDKFIARQWFQCFSTCCVFYIYIFSSPVWMATAREYACVAIDGQQWPQNVNSNDPRPTCSTATSRLLLLGSVQSAPRRRSFSRCSFSLCSILAFEQTR